MQCSPINAIPCVALVEPGTAGLVRSAGAKVVSSADLVQKYEASWSQAQLESHLAAEQDLAARLAFPKGPQKILLQGHCHQCSLTGMEAMLCLLSRLPGAEVFHLDAVVCAIVGDGGFQMTLQDLATAVEWGLPIKIYIINNGSLGMVRQWQQLFYRERYSHVWLRNPDFAKLAEAFGAVGITGRRPEEVGPAVERSLAVTDRPCLVDIVCAPGENCYPMIPSGQSVNEMIVEGE